ncbi:uncharacterized protein LOC133391395 isoform X2 [Anopheles gambiae]|uniref:uncharacterized protein LOC133391395 isoform X2 n=1 Tax=Anopheles gambiae TaxID=7165 RepID=UPI002AC92F6B|nr:uncharacterized protein LOC133391395 isoform X2 [Anopheles gambiae]
MDKTNDIKSSTNSTMVSNITRENVQKTTKYPSLVDLNVVSHPCSTRTSSTAIFYYDGARIFSEHNYVDNARFIELPTENDSLTLPAPYNPFVGPKTSKELNINSTFLTNDTSLDAATNNDTSKYEHQIVVNNPTEKKKNFYSSCVQGT